MKTFIKVMQRIKEDNKEQMVKILFSYNSYTVPRSGELIDIMPYGCYKVLEVINRERDVILEVEKYENPLNPPITKLKFM